LSTIFVCVCEGIGMRLPYRSLQSSMMTIRSFLNPVRMGVSSHPFGESLLVCYFTDFRTLLAGKTINAMDAYHGLEVTRVLEAIMKSAEDREPVLV
jgi:hypothetical protein